MKGERGRPAGRPRGASCNAWRRAAAPLLLLAASLASLPFEESLQAASHDSTPARSATDSLPHLTWDDFFAKVETTGATFSDRLRALDGKRVVLRGFAVADPKPEGGLFLTRFPEAKLHPDDEDTLPWDSVGVVWRKGRKLPAIPKQPTIEGTLRLGNRGLGTETVILVLEDAVPHLEPVPAAKASTAGRPSESSATR